MFEIIRKIAYGYSEWNWSWNLDSALRYSGAIELIERLRPETVVEVGSGSRGISAYSGYPSFGVDLSFRSSIPPRLQKRIRASGALLPFSSKSVDMVISTDMLEHVDTETRPLVIKEIFRIVRNSGTVYITVPVGTDSEEADKRVNDAYKHRHGVPHPLLADHLRHRLPLQDEIIGLVEKEAAKCGWKTSVSFNTPIKLWELNLMVFGVEKYFPGLRHLQKLALKPLFPIFKRIKSGSNYRMAICASKRVDA